MREGEVWLRAFLTLTLGRDQWSVSRPGRFACRKKAHGTVGYKAGRPSQLVRTLWRRGEISTAVGNRTQVSRSSSPESSHSGTSSPLMETNFIKQSSFCFEVRDCYSSLKDNFPNNVVQPSTLQSPVVAICTTCFNIKNICILPTERVCMFRMVLAINCDCFPKQLGFVAET
jgi:hypothetical protein